MSPKQAVIVDMEEFVPVEAERSRRQQHTARELQLAI
jgi:hypothetical protein